jgi:hypothetical protein
MSNNTCTVVFMESFCAALAAVRPSARLLPCEVHGRCHVRADLGMQADNMFVANCMQPYCSVLGKGLSVLGVFQVHFFIFIVRVWVIRVCVQDLD